MSPIEASLTYEHHYLFTLYIRAANFLLLFYFEDMRNILIENGV